MAEEEEKLDATLRAIAAENLGIEVAHADIARRLGKIQRMMQALTSELGHTGADFVAGANTAADAANQALDHARLGGNAGAIVEAEHAQRLAASVQQSALSIQAYLASFNNELTRFKQVMAR